MKTMTNSERICKFRLTARIMSIASDCTQFCLAINALPLALSFYINSVLVQLANHPNRRLKIECSPQVQRLRVGLSHLNATRAIRTRNVHHEACKEYIELKLVLPEN